MADTSWRRALSEDEIPADFRNVNGDRSEKPASVQMAELGLEVATPLGTVNDIQAELEKDDPSYAKIAGMAGLELLGPAAGAVEMAAKAGNKSLQTAFSAMRIIVTIGWAVYPLGYIFGYLTGGVDVNALNVIYNAADFLNKIAFGLIIWAAAMQNTRVSRS